MSSKFATLLEAARIIEEQERLSTLDYHTASPYNNNSNNNNNNNSTNMNSTSSSRSNNTRSNQEPSPPISPLYSTTNGVIGENNALVGTGRPQEYAATILTAALARTNDGRNEEPYRNNNGHSLPTYLVIPGSSNQNDVIRNSSEYMDSLDITNYNNNHANSMQNQKNYRLSSSIPESNTNNSNKRKCNPLTPPPASSSKKLEITRTRSLSLSSTKITANGNGTIIYNGNVHNVLASATEDSSQSSLNLSSSGYLSGSSANSSVGGSSGGGGGNSGSNLNISSSNVSSTSLNGDQPMTVQTPVTGRRRTTSTNSNGAGTREVHNKLEKHRRAHLKECFEQLKAQLQLKDEEKKKTSNLAILGAAYRHVMTLKRKEREMEQQVEQLAKEKINSQKKIMALKRELAAKYDHSDSATVMSDGDIGNIPSERVADSLSDSVSISSGRGSTRYSSSSSLSSAATMSSPLSSSVCLQTAMPTAMSPVISVQSFSSPNSPHTISTSPSGNGMPLSLTPRNLSTTIIRDSPTPSIPSPSASSNSTTSSSPVNSSSLSTSPPIGISLKMSNVSNGVKCPSISPPNLSIVSPTTNPHQASTINFSTTSENILSPTLLTTTNSGIPPNINGTKNIQILHTKDLSGKNGICPRSSEIYDASPGMVLTNNSNTVTKEKAIFGDSEQPTKVIKVFNTILPHVVSANGVVVSQYPLSAPQPHSVRVYGTNGNVATIGLATQTGRALQQQTSNITTAPTGAQLHKLLAGNTATISRGSELSAINNSYTLKDGTAPGRRAVHLVTTPIQSPIVVSQGQAGNLAQLIAPQLGHGLNLSVTSINTQYLSQMKPMVVTVASNSSSTLSSVPPPSNSVAVATANANGSSL